MNSYEIGGGLLQYYSLRLASRNQATDRNILRLASRQAAHFLECRLFFRADRVSFFPDLIKAVMRAAELAASSVGRNQVKVPVEFVPDRATVSGRCALRNCKSLDAMLKGGMHRDIVLIERPI